MKPARIPPGIVPQAPPAEKIKAKRTQRPLPKKTYSLETWAALQHWHFWTENPPKHMSKTINCDWVECHVVLPFLDYDRYEHPFYKVVRDKRGTQQFRALYFITDTRTGEQVASLSSEAHSEMCMKAEHGILKIDNKYLYQADLNGYVKKFMEHLGLSFLNYTRVDICLDFIAFDNQHCEKFIEDVICGAIIKRHGTKWRPAGRTPTIENGQIVRHDETLSFGTKSSKVQYKLYNKTLEMAEKKIKPWIMDSWQANGWDGTSTIWRLEFELRNDTKYIIRTETGEVFRFNNMDILLGIRDLWKHFYDACFWFVVPEMTRNNTVKKIDRCQRIKLIEDFHFETTKFVPDGKKQVTKKAKVFLKNLDQLAKDLRGQHEHLAIAGNELLTFFTEQCNLTTWAQNKMEYKPDRHTLDYMLREKVIRQTFSLMAQEEEPGYVWSTESAA